MGILDHRKQWDFMVAASVEQCESAFQRALAGKAGTIRRMKARWSVTRAHDSQNGAHMIGVFEGLRGFAGAATALSDVAQSAKGSSIAFSAERGEGPRTRCSMWLKSSSGRFGGLSTDLAPVFKAYMGQVEKELRALDGNLALSKD